MWSINQLKIYELHWWYGQLTALASLLQQTAIWHDVGFLPWCWEVIVTRHSAHDAIDLIRDICKRKCVAAPLSCYIAEHAGKLSYLPRSFLQIGITDKSYILRIVSAIVNFLFSYVVLCSAVVLGLVVESSLQWEYMNLCVLSNICYYA